MKIKSMKIQSPVCYVKAGETYQNEVSPMNLQIFDKHDQIVNIEGVKFKLTPLEMAVSDFVYSLRHLYQGGIMKYHPSIQGLALSKTKFMSDTALNWFKDRPNKELYKHLLMVNAPYEEMSLEDLVFGLLLNN